MNKSRSHNLSSVDSLRSASLSKCKQKFGQKLLSLPKKNSNMDGKVDIRDDEEQLKKGQEVLELLVAAGYFRARIKVLYLYFKQKILLNFLTVKQMSLVLF